VQFCHPTATRPPAQTLRIISGSENQTLEPLLHECAKRANLTLEVTYKGSVDIMLELERGSAIPYDAVWPANSLWIALGDKQGVVKAQESIWRSPVAFGVKKSVADRLGWVGRDVTVDYENQLIEYSVEHPELREVLLKQINILYPRPTTWATHTMMALNPNGVRLLDALKDPAIQKLAWERHGFRTGLIGV